MMELLPFQQEGVEEIEWFNGRPLVGWEMGLGKTFTSLSFWHRHRASASPCIIVCPASVKYAWEQEALKAFRIRATVLEGTKPPRGKSVAAPPELVVLNYDILKHWVDWLQRLKPKMVILDEVQVISNHTSQRSRASKKLCDKVPRVLGLSGTPLLNRPIELFSILNILRPDVFNSRWSFAHRYCDPRLTPWGWEYKGCTNSTELHQLLTKTCLMRRRKVDVLKELPGKTRTVIPIPLKDMNEYRRASLDFIAWLSRQDPVKANRAAKAAAMVKMGYLLRLTAELKLPSVIEWINNCLDETDSKLVVFGVHKKILEEMKSKCRARSVTIDGSVTGRLRQAVVASFQQDKQVRVLFGNIKAAGVGITLTASHTVAFAELAWRPGDHTQAEDRCHRIGTTENVAAYYLVAKDTIEEKLCKIIQQKQSIVSSVLDGGSLDEDLDIYDQLSAELLMERNEK